MPPSVVGPKRNWLSELQVRPAQEEGLGKVTRKQGNTFQVREN